MVLFLAAKGLRGPLVLVFCGLVMTGDEQVPQLRLS